MSNMKRIVIQVHVETDKCKKKALKIAAETQGVQSISLAGESSDLVVITGEVDAVCLTNKMRKKLRSAELLSVQNVTYSDEGEDEHSDDDRRDENDIIHPCPICEPRNFQPPIMNHPPIYYDVQYTNGCYIL